MPKKEYTRKCEMCGVIVENVGHRMKYCESCRKLVERNKPIKKHVAQPDRLSAKMRHFRKYGYNTYGKGQAAIELGIIPPYEDDTVQQKSYNCQICGKAFDSKWPKKYCSDFCYTEANRRLAHDRYERRKNGQQTE